MTKKTTKMTILLSELKEKLEREDEVSLLELLEINSSDLVEAFEHRIEARYEILVLEYEGEEDE